MRDRYLSATEELARQLENMPSERLRRQVLALQSNPALLSAARFAQEQIERGILTSTAKTALLATEAFQRDRVGHPFKGIARPATLESVAAITASLNSLVGSSKWDVYRETAQLLSNNTALSEMSKNMQAITMAAGRLQGQFGALAELNRKMGEISSSIATVVGAANLPESAILKMTAVAETLAEDKRFAEEEETLTALRNILDRLNENSANPSYYDLIGLFVNLITILTFILMKPDFREEDRAALNEARDASVELLALAEAETQRQEYLASLQQGVVKQRANVREADSRSAKRMAILPQATTVFIEEKQGRWFDVWYLDATGEWSRGWVWQHNLHLVSE